ncbi:hypothetical protein B0T25DRAFT_90410 [Lasiosphaeria hispida]|uniref:Secreted protein n=1 Tax=Lasiosphaeria hispida TaxID=260671 RepID=A0AAJ0HQC4_9PEZI|nr:hypothetical protein B0T25DRAFT_90410 [Lasiosphaeria hispida]
MRMLPRTSGWLGALISVLECAAPTPSSAEAVAHSFHPPHRAKCTTSYLPLLASMLLPASAKHCSALESMWDKHIRIRHFQT